jgi:hypothetical protein
MVIITLADNRPKALYRRFSYAIDLKLFKELGTTPDLITNHPKLFTHIGLALQQAIRNEKVEDHKTQGRKEAYVDTTLETNDPIVTLLYVDAMEELKKFRLAYQYQDIYNGIHVAQVILSNTMDDALNFVTKVTEKMTSSLLNSLRKTSTATEQPHTFTASPLITISVAPTDLQFPQIDVKLLDELTRHHMHTLDKSLRFRLTEKLQSQPLFHESILDVERANAFFPQVMASKQSFETAMQSKLNEMQDKIALKEAQLKTLTGIMQNEAAATILPGSPIWRTFLHAQVKPSIKHIEKELVKLRAVPKDYQRVINNDFTSTLETHARKLDEHQNDISNIRNELIRSIQIVALQSWISILKRGILDKETLDFYSNLFFNFTTVFEYQGALYLQFIRDMHRRDLSEIKEQLDQLYAALNGEFKCNTENLLKYFPVFLGELRANLRKINITYKTKTQFTFIGSNTLNADGFNENYPQTTIPYQNAALASSTASLAHTATELLVNYPADPLLNSFDSIVSQSHVLQNDLQEIKTMIDVQNPRVAVTHTTMTSVHKDYKVMKVLIDELKLTALRVNIALPNVVKAFSHLYQIYLQLSQTDEQVRDSYSSMTNAPNITAARAASEMIDKRLLGTDGKPDSESAFNDGVTQLYNQINIVKDEKRKADIDIQARVLDLHYIDTILKFKSFTQGEIDYWNQHTTQFLCLGGTRVADSNKKVPLGVALMIKELAKVNERTLTGPRAKKIWQDLQKISKNGADRKTDFFNSQQPKTTQLYNLTCSGYKIEEMEDVSDRLRAINNDWRYQPSQVNDLSVTEVMPEHSEVSVNSASVSSGSNPFASANSVSTNPFANEEFNDFYSIRP